MRKETIRRLTTLCTLAACALDRLGQREEWPEDDELGDRCPTRPELILAAGSDHDQGHVCRIPRGCIDATFLNAVLPFAFNQARRHNEPLSLVCVAIDRLGGIQELLGRDAVDHLVRNVAETVASLDPSQ